MKSAISCVLVLFFCGCINALVGETTTTFTATTTLDSGPSDTLSMTDYSITVDDTDRNCISDDDCALVITRCDYCMCGTPVNEKYAGKYARLLQEKCIDYNGELCDIECRPYKLLCLEESCVLKVD